MPCVITFTKPSYIPRIASLAGKLNARKTEIKVLTPDDIPGLDRDSIGINGSPTRVIKTEHAMRGRSGVILNRNSSAGAASELVSILRNEGLI